MLTKQRDPLQQMFRATFQDVTPVRLRLFLIVNCIAVALFCLLSIWTIKLHQHAAKIVGWSTAPSVIAAHNIMTGTLQMDNYLANELLYPSGSKEGNKMAVSFEKCRVNVCKEFVKAARNITFAAEQEPIENLQINLGEYAMHACHARDAHQGGNGREAVYAYRASLDTLKKKLLPAADALNKANSEVLEATYADEKSRSAIACSFCVVVTGFVLIALLVITQVYVRQRFRRQFNVPLVIATVCTFLWVHHLYIALRESAEHLIIGKEDAYDSIVSLLAARANAYDASSAQSRWLLDREHAQEHEKTFKDEINSIARFSGNHTFALTTAQAEKELANSEKIALPGFEGKLAEEFNNIRFEGEGQAALDTLKALSEYCAADERMRKLEQSGAHEEALKIGLGYDPESTNYPFSRFDDALGRALRINQDHFDRETNNAYNELKGLEIISQLVALLIVICVYVGLRPRMAEYM